MHTFSVPVFPLASGHAIPPRVTNEFLVPGYSTDDPMKYRSGMERICSQCHAALGAQTKADWCPACGGAVIDRLALPQSSSECLPHAVVLDHRGIVLPRRHAVGGIISPQ
jgi:hypothetical protein